MEIKNKLLRGNLRDEAFIMKANFSEFELQ